MFQITRIVVVGLGCALGLAIRVAADGLIAFAPERQRQGTNSVNEPAGWTYEGHVTYLKTQLQPPYPPTYHQYAVTAHDKTRCGKEWCFEDENAEVVTKIGVSGGAGDIGDNVQINIWHNVRMKIGVDSYISNHPVSTGAVLPTDDTVVTDTWGGPGTLTTKEAVKYEWDAWQENPWGNATSTAAL